MSNVSANSKDSMTILSRLLLPRKGSAEFSEVAGEVKAMSRDRFADLLMLANENHVIVRGMEVFLEIAREAGDKERAEWAETALTVERARIDTAVLFLSAICVGFEEEGHDVTVIKSLDHWPDLGSDLDLYTNTDPEIVIQMMKDRFQAELATRSWGDRLACKWNFIIPGLPESVEIHMGRLGQTGEQMAIASSLAERSRRVKVGNYTFPVTSVSDRLMISVLQRMYRHFYFRLCDILDSAGLVESDAVDYADLRSAAERAGIWEGVATYLAIVSDYVEQYRGSGINLPHFVRASARFGGGEVFYRKNFLRVPIMPQSAGLYGLQLTGLLKKRELHSTARLGLLPWLATAAMVGQKITGSDKGIW
jgi:hypothetical protein